MRISVNASRSPFGVHREDNFAGNLRKKTTVLYPTLPYSTLSYPTRFPTLTNPTIIPTLPQPFLPDSPATLAFPTHLTGFPSLPYPIRFPTLPYQISNPTLSDFQPYLTTLLPYPTLSYAYAYDSYQIFYPTFPFPTRWFG